MSLLGRLSDYGHVMALRRYALRVSGEVAEIDPEPAINGSEAVALRLLNGEIRFGGTTQTLPERPPPFGQGDARWEDEAQRFQWLGDLATLGTPDARELAQYWTSAWLHLYGTGTGPGWTIELTTARLARLISHYSFLIDPEKSDFTSQLQLSLRLATTFLARRWHKATDPLTGLNALSAAVIGACEVPGATDNLRAIVDTHARECSRHAGNFELFVARNPAEVLAAFTHVVTIKARLSAREELVPPALNRFLTKVAPLVRLLRHSDGALARFHGADRTAEGEVDRALAFAGIRTPARSGEIALGFARLSAGRTSLIADVGAPPPIEASARAHASALAFEMTSGRRPVIVSAGPGDPFGPAWVLAGRATPSHSTLSFTGLSQARIAKRGRQRDGDPVLLDHGPSLVRARTERTEDGTELSAEHNAYVPSHGLWHKRLIRLTLDGRQIEAIDRLECRKAEDRAIFDAAREKHETAFSFTIRFHLHPDVVADVAMNGAAVSLKLKSGEVWLFRHDGTSDVALEPSVWLTRSEAEPVPSEQIVLSSVADEPQRELRWTLSKAQDTPRGIRDLGRDTVET